MSRYLTPQQKAAVERRKQQFQSPGHYTAKDRDQIPAEDFGDPQNQKYPIVTQQDVHDAASLIGKAANPAAVKARIKAIAKRKGFALPDAWQDEETKEPERMATPQLAPALAEVPPIDDSLALLDEAEAVTRAIAEENGYEVTITRKAKAAPPPADEEDDEPEDKEEENDEEPEDEEEEGEAERAASPDDLRALFDQAQRVASDLGAEMGLSVQVTPVAETVTRAATVYEMQPPSGVQEVLYVPITRRDDEKRIIEGVLSNEEEDTFGTIFDYESMKRAVTTRYRGNIREQHDPKKAVGKALQFFFDDDKREVRMRAQISQAANDTWTKIQEGILTGFSIGAAKAKTVTRTVGGRAIPCYVDYDLAETSVVDAPSNPGSAREGLTIFRAAGFGVEADEYSADLADEAVAEATPAAPPTTAAVTEAPVAPPAIPPADSTGDPEMDALIRAEEAKILREMGGVPQYPDVSNAPSLAVPGVDYPGIQAKMNDERGGYHVHSHPYAPGDVHENDHEHTHADGTVHPHRHLHAHAGHGDGSKPHVHLNDHGHEYRSAAPDNVAASFIAQDDPRVREYVMPTAASAEPVVVPIAAAAGAVAASAPPIAAATPPTPEQRVEVPDQTRYGKTISGDTANALHVATDQLLHTCADGGCQRCQMLLAVIDPDQDGDDDTDSDLDTDNDMPMSRAQQALLTRSIQQTVQTATAAELTRAVAPVVQQLRGIAARLAATPTPDLSTMRTDLSEVIRRTGEMQGLMERIASQDAPGQPIVRAAGTPQDKRIAAYGAAAPISDLLTPEQLQALRAANLALPPSADQMVTQTAELIRRQLAG